MLVVMKSGKNMDLDLPTLLDLFIMLPYHLAQWFSNFFLGDPNVSIKILRDPKQRKNVNLPKLVTGGVGLLIFRVDRSLRLF